MKYIYIDIYTYIYIYIHIEYHKYYKLNVNSEYYKFFVFINLYNPYLVRKFDKYCMDNLYPGVSLY